MPETLTESVKRFNDELDRIKAAISPSEPAALSQVYTARSMPHTLVVYMDRMVSTAMGKDEREEVLALRILDMIDTHIEELVINRRLLKKYIRERKDDDYYDADTESNAHNKA